MELTNGKPVAVGCPRCGIANRLIVRTNRHTGEQFLGCPNYPQCKFTQNIPDSIRMRAAGQPELFDNDS